MISSKCCTTVLPFLAAAFPVATSAQDPTAGPPYRLPLITLAQPPSGGSLPQDKPVILFRFTAGEPTDPIDIGSFRVSVDGVNQTSRFQMTASEAWGPVSGEDDPLELGEHELTARICSARGACSSTTAVITIGAPGTGADETPKPRRKRLQFLDAILEALRNLIRP